MKLTTTTWTSSSDRDSVRKPTRRTSERPARAPPLGAACRYRGADRHQRDLRRGPFPFGVRWADELVIAATCSTTGNHPSGSARAAPGTPGRCRKSWTRPASTLRDHLRHPRPRAVRGDRGIPRVHGPHNAVVSSSPRRPHRAARPICCYLRPEESIYLTYWTTARGDEVMSPLFGLLVIPSTGDERSGRTRRGWPQIPTHSFLRTDEHGAPMGPRSGGRPVYQWTRPGVTGSACKRAIHVIELAHGGGVLVESLLAASSAPAPD